jgi:hypothetical protein
MRTALPIAAVLLLAACGDKSTPDPEGTNAGECTDGVDNDQNGRTDCDDPNCATTADCTGGGDTSDSGGATDTGGTTDTGGMSDSGTPSPETLVINEFMASNATTIADETGAYPDWIELYNTGSADVSLDGFTITDDLTKPDKFAFPSGLTVAAGGYLLLFADGDTDQGDEHVGFSLAATGEEIGLYDDQGRPIDRLTYEQQATDWSAARIPDGSDNWQVTDQPTPGESNGN